MSNLKYQLYLASVMTLAKSLIIKHNATALAMNASLKETSAVTGIVVDNERPETWKYYLNMAGIYHETDELIMITSLDTMEIIPFTKEKMMQHRGTAREYAFGSKYYLELVTQYPQMETLIRGVINPVDITTALSAPDYTILHYDVKQVESQELDLMANLQKWLFAAQDRWLVKDYQYTDNLYHLAVLGKLYSFIPVMINVIRTESLRTYQAHTYFVYNYLDSNGYLGKFKKELNLEQAMWLYRNLAWVNANAGKQVTFDALLDAIMTKRQLPLGSYDVRQNDSLMPLELNPFGEAIRTELNLYENNVDRKTIRKLDYVFEKELSVAKDNDLVLTRDLAEAKTSLAMTNLSRLPTKVYESDVIDTTNSEPYKLDQVMFNHWIHLSYVGKYTSVINVKNPYTTELMTMTVKDALLVWLYVSNKTMGITLTEIPRLKARSVLRQPLPRYADLRPLADPKCVTDAQIDKILDNLISIGLIISTESFNEQMTLVHANMLEHRLMWATIDELRARYEMEGMLLRVYQTVAYDFYPTGTLYADYFRTKGWNIEQLVETDCEILMVDLWNLALGYDVSQKVALKDVQKAMLTIMKQLGTYDTQYIQTINENASYALDVQPVRIATPKTKLFSKLGSNKYGIDHVKFQAWYTDFWDLKKHTVLNAIKTLAIPLVKIDVEVPNVVSSGVTAHMTIPISLSRIMFKWPNTGDAGDLVWDNDLGALVIEPYEGKDLAVVIDQTDLDGLHYEE